MLAQSKLWWVFQHRDQRRRSPKKNQPAHFSALYRGQQENAAVIIYSFILWEAFCWTAIKACEQTYSKMFWHAAQSPLVTRNIMLSRRAVACCNSFFFFLNHKLLCFSSVCFALFSRLNQRGHLEIHLSISQLKDLQHGITKLLQNHGTQEATA